MSPRSVEIKQERQAQGISSYHPKLSLLSQTRPIPIMTSKPLKVCLLGIAFNNYNLGIGALADGALRCILHTYPDAKLSVMEYGYERFEYSFQLGERRVPVEFVNIRFSKKFYLKNNIAYLLLLAFLLKYVMPTKLRDRIVGRNSTLQHLAEADVVGSIAGGDSFSDIYGLVRLLYVSLPQVLVLWMGKRLVLFPQTIGPFRGWTAKRIAKFIMSRAELIYSRDQSGAEEARAILGGQASEKVKFCYDVGFLVEARPPAVLNLKGLPEQREAASCLVGLNVSGLLYAGGYNRKNMFGLKTNYRELIDVLVESLLERKGATVLLVPHVWRGAGPGEHLESDDNVCRQIYEKLQAKYSGRIATVEGTYNSNEIKYVIGKCDFFIGSRMHACIAALSQSVPSVAISYSDKFFGVMESVGMSEMVADPRKMSLEEILSIVDSSLARRVSLRQQLESTIPKVKEQTIQLLRAIAATPQESGASHS
jgi:colanic acid/amylovoran biosynthesis protein